MTTKILAFLLGLACLGTGLGLLLHENPASDDFLDAQVRVIENTP